MSQLSPQADTAYLMVKYPIKMVMDMGDPMFVSIVVGCNFECIVQVRYS